MAKGKSYGVNRTYQQLCQAIIRELRSEENLIPYSGDGIDVSIPVCGTNVSFDVALTSSRGKLVVVECRRWEAAIKQEALFAFLGKVLCLRKELEVEVEGIFVTRKNYQKGAIKIATAMDIKIAVCEQDQPSDEFIISFKQYDPQQARTKHKTYGHIKSHAHAYLIGGVRPTGSLNITVFRADGSVENIGNVDSK